MQTVKFKTKQDLEESILEHMFSILFFISMIQT